MNFKLYAQRKEKSGCCKPCQEHFNLSPHMIGKKGDRCPTCCSDVLLGADE